MVGGFFAGLLVGSRTLRRSLYALVAFGIPVVIWWSAPDSAGRHLGLILLAMTAGVYLWRGVRAGSGNPSVGRSERLHIRDRWY